MLVSLIIQFGYKFSLVLVYNLIKFLVDKNLFLKEYDEIYFVSGMIILEQLFYFRVVVIRYVWLLSFRNVVSFERCYKYKMYIRF